MNTVICTGGTGGLGAAVILRLIGAGWRCIVPYRNEEEAQRLRARVVPQQRDQLYLLHADMCAEGAVAEVFRFAADQGEYHALVHLLGGIRGWQAIADTQVEDWDALMDLNLRSLFLSARLAMKYFLERGGGRIVTIGAMASIKPGAHQAGYGVAKAGVLALTRILADEGRTCGVTANCILPSTIVTEANLSWGTPKQVATWVQPEEIASAVQYLLSDEARALNGTDLRLFGGMNI
jgi:NAD(P)-dependent dehydrogenase (short-subunit alcohol dehydrogenase family)